MKRACGLMLSLACLAGCHAAPAAPISGASTPTLVLERRPFQAVLVERGEVGSAQELKLSSPFSSKVDTLLPEGSTVKPGQVVLTLGAEEVTDKWERQRLKDHQNALQLPLTAERGRLDVWRLGLERDEAALDLRMAKLRVRQLAEVRDATSIVEASQTLGTLKAQRETLLGTLTEAEGLHRKGYLSDAELAAMRRRTHELEAQAFAARARLVALEAGPRREELTLEGLKVEEAAAGLAGAEKKLGAGRVAARLDLAAAQRALVLSGEALRYRRKLRDSAHVVAPGAGVVIYDTIWTGSTVAKLKPGDAVDEGTGLVVVADTSKQVVRAKVNDAVAARLKPGMAVRCTVDAYPGLVAEGRVASLAPLAGARLDGDLNKLQAVDVLVALARPDARLRPGMSANLDFVLEREDSQLAVPTEAIGHDAQGPFVWVLAKPTGLLARLGLASPAFSRRAVTLGSSNERESVVITGLSAGDRLAARAPKAGPP